MLKEIAGGEHSGDRPSVCYHTGDKATYDYFCSQRAKYLPGMVPAGMELVIVRWQQGCIHDRYILTERGGLNFGTGLDEGNSPAEDLANLLDETVHRGVWADYTGATGALVPSSDPARIVVRGERQPA